MKILFTFLSADNACDGLLEGGQLINNTWKPVGCTIHNYTSEEFSQCFLKRSYSNNNKTNLLVFIGDSVMRQRYSAMKQLLLDQPIGFTGGYSQEFVHNVSHTIIQFHWKAFASEVLEFLSKWESTYT